MYAYNEFWLVMVWSSAHRVHCKGACAYIVHTSAYIYIYVTFNGLNVASQLSSTVYETTFRSLRLSNETRPQDVIHLYIYIVKASISTYLNSFGAHWTCTEPEWNKSSFCCRPWIEHTSITRRARGIELNATLLRDIAIRGVELVDKWRCFQCLFSW